MKYIHKISFLFILFSFLLNFGEERGRDLFAQSKNIDSLLTLIKKVKEDTIQVNTINILAKEYANTGTYRKADSLSRFAIQLANKIKFKKGAAKSYTNIGYIYYLQGEYSKTLEYWLKALKVDEELKDKSGIAKHLGNIGIVYYYNGDYTRALDYYFKAQKVYEEFGNKFDISINLSNIGLIYSSQKDYPKALSYYFKALKIAEELKEKTLILSLHGNIGVGYWGLGDFPNAMDHYFQALKIAEELGDKRGISNQLANIGMVFRSHGDNEKALNYYFKSLKIAEALGKKNIISGNLANIGEIYITTGKFKEAEEYLKRAIAIDDSIDAKDLLREHYEFLSKLYDTTDRHEEALIYYKKAITLKDTLFSQENKKELVQKEMNYEFEKKEAITKAENEKQEAIAEEKSRKQKLVLVLVSCVLILVFVFASFIFRSFRITRKQKQIIEIKKTETDQQKKIIEEKNKDITDSIRYAKRIQDALMGEQGHVSLHLPEHFILFMPKDIVSGDFHWGAEKQGHWYFAAVDCTGHGVPGAVMSMLGISFLNDIVSSDQLFSPAEVLDRLCDRIIKELRQTGETGGSKDGMDISLARLNLKTNELQWAGANNPLNLIRSGQLEEIKADKQPIGYHPENHPFTNHEIQLQKGDSIYFYTDGYADQFGGPKGKKFKYKQLEDLIIANNQLAMKDQKEILKKHFTEWKGALEQVDDVCVFGVRV